MKTLLLMRHAKSSWKDTALTDHERPLNKRGRRDAALMGQVLGERKLIPERILGSTAIRTRQTAELLAEASSFRGEAFFLDRLYLAEADEYVQTLKELPDGLNSAMVIGHNPGLETLLQILSGKIESLPTAVLAHITLPIERWADLNDEVMGELVDVWRPREVRKEEEKEKDKDKEKEKDKAKEKGKKKK